MPSILKTSYVWCIPLLEYESKQLSILQRPDFLHAHRILFLQEEYDNSDTLQLEWGIPEGPTFPTNSEHEGCELLRSLLVCEQSLESPDPTECLLFLGNLSECISRHEDGWRLFLFLGGDEGVVKDLDLGYFWQLLTDWS